MIKIDNIETFFWEAAFRGMRNPMESWDKSDSFISLVCNDTSLGKNHNLKFNIGENDMKRAKSLINAGSSHRKFLRFIEITCDVSASLKWFDEFNTYEFIVKNSTSQMHTITKKELNHSSFSGSPINDLALQAFNNTIDTANHLIRLYNNCTDKFIKKSLWDDIILIMPQSYLYKRTVKFNYETFITMYLLRKAHKLDGWVKFCEILRRELPYMDLFLSFLEEK